MCLLIGCFGKTITTVRQKKSSDDGGLETDGDIALKERPTTSKAQTVNGQVTRPSSAKSTRSNRSNRSKSSSRISSEDGQSAKAWTSESEIYLRVAYIGAMASTALSLIVMLSSFASPAWEKVSYDNDTVAQLAAEPDSEWQVSTRCHVSFVLQGQTSPFSSWFSDVVFTVCGASPCVRGF